MTARYICRAVCIWPSEGGHKREFVDSVGSPGVIRKKKGRESVVQLNSRIHVNAHQKARNKRERICLSVTRVLEHAEDGVSEKEHTGDALASSADEGRGTLRKAPVSRVQAHQPGMSEWGNPARVKAGHRESEGNRAN
jgi:hypothetical protein